MDISGDLQCQAILNGLRDLENVLEKPLADTALNLPKDAENLQKKDLLIRLKHSLIQYLERTGDLFYIALIGHFSSGKSSTINSLLNLWGSPNQRPVDLNPTDKIITIITHKKNANSLIGVASRGSVALRVETLESDLLKDIVLTDTPGTGDPHLVKEMARDFLPICDLVLFFFSASSPLDSTDIPLLNELHSQLPFIPLKFIVTRADELRINPQQPVSSDNFDYPKAAAFIAQVMSRITRLFQHAKYNNNDFLLIDNKKQFNIDSLRNDLMSRADPANISNKLKMHSHKINFYLRSSEGLREHFSSFLDDKLTELNRIIEKAKQNIIKYNESVNITNTNLTMSWFHKLNSIVAFKKKVNERIRNLPALPPSMLYSERISKSMSDMRSDIGRRTTVIAEQVQQLAKQTIRVQMERELSEALRTLNNTNLDTLRPQDHGISPIRIQWTFGDIEISPVDYLARKADGARSEVQTFINEAANDIQRSFQDIQRLINQRYVINECEEIVSHAQSTLAKDLDSYFQMVEVYRTGVFAIGTKDSIGKLGIGAKFNEIERDFTDEDKESIKIKVKQDLFPSYDDIIATATTKLAGISGQIQSVLAEMGDEQIESPPSSLGRIEREASEPLSVLMLEVKNELQRETDEFLSSVQTRVAGVIANVLRDYDRERAEARHKRKITYLIIIGVLTLITISGFAIYHWQRDPVGQLPLNVIGWGLLVQIIGSALVFATSRLWDNYPKMKLRIKENHSALLSDQITTTLNEALKDQQFSILNVSVLGKKVGKIYTALTSSPNDAWQVSIEERYINVRTWLTKYQEIRQTYLDVMESFLKDCGRYFEDSQGNLATLRSAAQAIKERAIEPSFNLLENTSEQLNEVKEEIIAIRFT